MGVCNVWTVLVAVVGVLVATTFAVNGRLPELQQRDLSGQVVLITGATGGIGRETARTLAHWGAHVIIGARNETKGQRVKTNIENSAADPSAVNVEVWAVDLEDLKSVEAFATRFQKANLPLHVLINNAGVGGYWELVKTKDRFERTFQVNHLSHFYLTHLLLPQLKASAPARVVNVASEMHFFGKIDDFQNLNSEKSYNQIQVYSNTKLYNVLFSNELNRRLTGTGVVSNSLHPGFVHTDFGSDMPWLVYQAFNMLRKLIARSDVQGAVTSVYAATSDDDAAARTGGVYFDSAKVHEQSVAAQSLRIADRLWRASEAHLAAEGFDVPNKLPPLKP